MTVKIRESAMIRVFRVRLASCACIYQSYIESGEFLGESGQLNSGSLSIVCMILTNEFEKIS